MGKISCPKCRSKKVYLLSNGKRKCSQCKYEFTPHRLPLYLTRDQWREIIRWFLLEQSSQNISLRTVCERKRVLRALTYIRTSLTKDVPEIFSGTVEVDETYLGGQWKNNEDLSEIRDLNEDEVQRNNRYSGSSVAMVRSGPRLLMTLELKHFNLSS